MGSAAVNAREHWKGLPRDNKGRWMKKKGKSATKKKKPISKKKASTPASTTKVKEELDGIKKDFMMECPRCSGDMGNFRIRCGPEKTVKVKKCKVCNFWLPLAET